GRARREKGIAMKRPWPLVVVLVLAAGGGFWLWLRSRAPKPVTLSGAVEARNVEVGSLLGGRVAKVFVEEGATVAAGDPIVAFETDLIDHHIQEQEAPAPAPPPHP